MNKLHTWFFCKPARMLCVAWAALFIAACGAGTGGTGSGPPAAAADAITSASGSPAALVTQQPILGTWTQADVSATFEANKIDVTQGCEKFEFAGDWTLDANQQVQVQGSYTGCVAGSASISASLVVQVHPTTPGTAPQTLSVLITDATGQVLIYGPLLGRN
jgi:hypothetical protein